ncbi:hypothetical protein HDU91_001680, partial [Kappamyces sp. JEL0680]
MQTTFKKYGHKDGWNEMYKQDITPWNLGQASPALQSVEPRLAKTGRFLVPGCGEGHDCFLLAQRQAARQVIGVDLSELAVQGCKQRLLATPLSNLDFHQADFFGESVLEENSFDFVFDYTFLCALHPSMRSEWASRMGKLIRPGGTLLTLMYPLVDDISKADLEDGPPFPLSVSV